MRREVGGGSSCKAVILQLDYTQNCYLPLLKEIHQHVWENILLTEVLWYSLYLIVCTCRGVIFWLYPGSL